MDSVRGPVTHKGPYKEGKRDSPEVTKARGPRKRGVRGHKRERSRNSGVRHLVSTDHCTVAAPGDFDEQRIGLTLTGVVLEQPGAKTAGFDPYSIVYSGIIRGITIEDVDRNAVLLERFGGMGNAVVKDVAKEELATMSAVEGTRANNAFQLSFDGVVVRESRQ